MENTLIKFLKYRFTIVFIFILTIVGGIYALNTLPIDAFPDLTNNQVAVITDCKGMASVEVEQLVTIPIEGVMNGIPDVSEVRSISKFGISIVTVVFKDSVKTYFARQLINERIQTIASKIPSGLQPELAPPTTAMGEIYQYVLEGDGYSATELKTLNDWDIKYQLRKVPGLSEVNSWGGFTKEYQVTLHPEKLLQYNLTIDEVFNAIRENNENFTGGVVEHDAEQYIVRGLGKVNSLDDIQNIVIKAVNGTPVILKDLAEVSYGKQLRQGAVTKDGKGEIVTGMTMMLKGENSRNIISKIKEKIKEIQKNLPPGIKILPFYDQTNLVEQTVNTLKNNLLEGGTLVIVVLLVMLGNFKAALIVSLTIPLSMMFSFMGMKWLGISANIMSLGAIDFGMIVDSSVVIVENTIRKLSHNHEKKSNFEIIQDSIREMTKPILFGTLIITVVYIPILSMEGIEYKMFSPMVFTVSFALLGSLLISLTLVPVICTFVLKGNVQEKDSIIIKILAPLYKKTLDIVLQLRKTTVSVSLIVFVMAISLVPFLGTEFVPKLDEGDILVETRNIPSISLDEAVRKSTLIEQTITALPEVKTVVSKTGRPDLATEAMGTHQTDVYVILKNKKEWRKGLSKENFIDEISAKLNNNVPGANFNFTQPIAMRIDELVSGVRSDIAVKLFGEDSQVLQSTAENIRNILATVRGNTDLQVEALSGNMQILVNPDRLKMAQYGVKITDISKLTETAVMGTKVSEVIEGKKRFALRVSFPEGNKMSVESLKNLVLRTDSGKLIKLEQVAEVTLKEDLDSISREFGERRIVIQCNVRNRDIGSFVKEAQAKIDQNVQIPTGYYINWSGQFENQQRALKRLSFIVPLSILVIFILLMATFSSVKQSLIVLLNVPFALTGGIFALWIRGIYLSVPAIIGFIALFGVAVLNGIVLMSTINKFVEETGDIKHSILEACEERLRPVLMTAFVAGLGFLPMAISSGSGAEVQKPLATVVIGGIISSTMLTLVVLPALYSIFTKEKPVTVANKEVSLTSV